QLLLGSLAAGVVGAALPAATPAVVGLLAVVTAAALAGGGLGAVAGVLRARFGVHEVIATLLLNRVVEALVPYLLQHGAGASGYRTADAVAGARLMRLESFGPLASALGGSAVSLAAPLALVVVALALRWQERSAIGRELRWVGLGPDACAAQGIPVGARWALALTLSGALTALGAAATVSGYKGYYELGLGAGAGFGGIAVAMLGGESGVGLVAAALLLATLAQAGLVLNASLPREAMDVLTATVLIAAAAGRRRP
ncbi:MAG: ABC transporter permease, partial [Myxococcales bacterium]